MDRGNERGADVVSLSGYTKSMSYNPIAEVEAYWEALRGNRVVPLRSDVDPRGIERALENTFLIERIAPGLARFRLAGAHLNDLMGMEVRGMPLTSFFTPDARKEMQEALAEAFEGPSVASVTLVGEGGMSRPPLSGRLIILPLKSDLGDISRAIGCLVTDGDLGRKPRRFNIQSKTIRALGPFGMTPQPDAEAPKTPAPTASETSAPQSPQEKPAGFAEAPAAFAPALSSPRKPGDRSHLRLVKSDSDADAGSD